jgi:hypothetical protein
MLAFTNGSFVVPLIQPFIANWLFSNNLYQYSTNFKYGVSIFKEMYLK